MGVLAKVLGTLFDFGAADWRSFVHDSYTDVRGPHGLSAAELAHLICRILDDACKLAQVCRTWCAGLAAWRASWLQGLRHIIPAERPGGHVVNAATILMLLRIGHRNMFDILKVTEELVFKERRWGVALEQMELSHLLPEQGADQDREVFLLRKVSPAFSAFAQELFNGVDASWLPNEAVPERLRYRSTSVRLSEEMVDLLQPTWLRPESLRGRSLLFCDGANGRLLTREGTPLHANFPEAFEKLHAQLSHAYEGLDPPRAALIEVVSGWVTRGQRAGHRPCHFHLFTKPRTDDTCSRCQKSRGWVTLCATMKLRFSVNFVNLGHQRITLKVIAPVVPFMAMSTDRRRMRAKFPGKALRRQLEQILDSKVNLAV